MRNFTRSQRLVSAFVLTVLVLIAAIGITSQIKTNLILVTPGPVYNLATSITGPNLNPELSKQSLYLTTIDAKRLSVWDYVAHQFHPTGQLEVSDPSGSTLSTATSDSIEEALLTSSQNVALIVAQDHVIGSSALAPVGAQVIYVTPGSPTAAANIRTGDVITAVAGTPVTTDTELAAALQGNTGQAVVFTVVTNGTSRQVTVPASPGATQPNLGLNVVTKTTGTSPYTLNLTGVGGPSGGLLMALNYTAAMTQGSLTGKHIVAGTGTIATTGQVGPIAGIADKVHAAASAGADVFFAPQQNAYDATTAAKGTKLQVVPVATYAQALSWLCHHGATSAACLIN